MLVKFESWVTKLESLRILEGYIFCFYKFNLSFLDSKSTSVSQWEKNRSEFCWLRLVSDLQIRNHQPMAFSFLLRASQSLLTLLTSKWENETRIVYIYIYICTLYNNYVSTYAILNHSDTRLHSSCPFWVHHIFFVVILIHSPKNITRLRIIGLEGNFFSSCWKVFFLVWRISG